MKENVNIIGHWRVSEVIGLELVDESIKTDEYVVQELRKENIHNDISYGLQVEFKSDMSFTSRYRSDDGMDHTDDVAGIYEWIDDRHIRLHVEKITISGRERDVNEEPNVTLGIYIVVKTDNGFRLIKCTPNETDEERLRYSDMLHTLPRIDTGGSGLRWIKLDPYNRDTNHVKILQKGLAADMRYRPDMAELVFSRRINEEVLAFIFRYEGKSIAAFYSAGPEIFAVMDYVIPQYLEIIEVEKEYVTYLISLERDERAQEANLPPKRDENKDLFLRCEIVTNYYDTKKESKREIFTLHYLYEYFYDQKVKAASARYDINCRTELSQLLKNGIVTQDNPIDKNLWKRTGEIPGGYEIEEKNIYITLLNYYGRNSESIPVLRDKQ